MHEITERTRVDRDKTVLEGPSPGGSNIKSMINNGTVLLKPTMKLKGQILSFIIFSAVIISLGIGI